MATALPCSHFIVHTYQPATNSPTHIPHHHTARTTHTTNRYVHHTTYTPLHAAPHVLAPYGAAQQLMPSSGSHPYGPGPHSNPAPTHPASPKSRFHPSSSVKQRMGNRMCPRHAATLNNGQLTMAMAVHARSSHNSESRGVQQQQQQQPLARLSESGQQRAPLARLFGSTGGRARARSGNNPDVASSPAGGRPSSSEHSRHVISGMLAKGCDVTGVSSQGVVVSARPPATDRAVFSITAVEDVELTEADRAPDTDGCEGSQCLGSSSQPRRSWRDSSELIALTYFGPR